MLLGKREIYASMFGFALAAIMRLFLLAITAPHSVIFFSYRILWIWPLAAVIGVVIGVHIWRSIKKPRIIMMILVVVLFLFALAGNLLISNIPVMQRLVPGFWVK